MTGQKIIWTPGQNKVFAFKDNLCVLAGAGTGKTMTLVECICRLLSGQIRGLEGLELSHVLALTYTEKAAQEMRNRLRLAINEEIQRAGFEPVQRDFWIRQRRFLDRAQISTIHGFCLHILRQHALEAGLDHDFQVQDNISELKNETIRETLLDCIENETPELSALLDYFPWRAKGRQASVGDFMADLINRTQTFGTAPGFETENSASLQDQITALTDAADIIENLIKAKQLNQDKDYYQQIVGFRAVVHDLIRSENPEEEALTRLSEMKEYLKGNWYAAKQAKAVALNAVSAFEIEKAVRQVKPLKQHLRRLAEKITLEFKQAKENQYALDFDDLLIKAREILATNTEVRANLKRRFKLILVDEFQDTNRLQADILAYLLEPPEQMDFPSGEPAYKSLKKAPRRLIIFGDPKQSIYRFRGAEVDVFQNMKRSLDTVSLKKNFRSQKRLIEFFNAFFEQAMPEASAVDDAYNYIATYGTEDRQNWFRPDLASDPAVEILEFAPGKNMEENRKREAEVIAAHIRSIISGQAALFIGEEGKTPGPGDLSILLRRFTHLKLYEQALRREEIPYYTVRGRGFYECQEIWDLISLLFYLACPIDGSALLGVLRSPLAGVSDDTLTQLVFPVDGSPKRDLREYFGPDSPPWPAGLTVDQIEALERIKGVLVALTERAGSAFPAELIEEAIEKTDYLAVLMAQYQGMQKAANVQRFIEITRHLPVKSLYAPRELARFLKNKLMEQSADPEAQLNQEGVEAVQIMTIHQAKGLQFPVVIVPDAGHKPRPSSNPLVFGADTFSLTFKDPLTDEKRQPSGYLRLKAEEQAREEAEYLRLLYVAATRAEDYLIFSGNLQAKNDTTSWLARLTDFTKARPDLIKKVSDSSFIEFGERVTQKHDDRLMDLPEPGPKALSILARTLKRETSSPKLIHINATDLGLYLNCPRRYFLEKVMNMPDKNDSLDHEYYPAGLDPRQKGNILHYLLETIKLDSLPDEDTLIAAARQAADREGGSPEPGQIEALARLAMDFMKSAWGRDLVRSRKGLVKREMPFIMRIEPDQPEAPRLSLTGEMDLFYVTPEGLARLVDYKYSHHIEPERYWAQLKIYALALKKAGLSRDLEAGLYFVNEQFSRLIQMEFEPGWDRIFETQLRKVAAELAQLMIPSPKEPEPLAACQDLECGFKYTCTV